MPCRDFLGLRGIYFDLMWEGVRDWVVIKLMAARSSGGGIYSCGGVGFVNINWIINVTVWDC